MGSRLPLTAERFGETIVLWRDPEGVMHGSVVRPDEGLDESPATDELVVRQVQGWIWCWRGDGAPASPPSEDMTGLPRSLSSHRWDMPVMDAMRAMRRARPSTRRIGPNLCSDIEDEAVGIVAAFVPVDDTTTEVLVRSYERRTRVTGLGRLMTSMLQRRVRRQLRRPPRPAPDRGVWTPPGASTR